MAATARFHPAPVTVGTSLLVKIGLLCFGYVPVFPAMVAAGWAGGSGGLGRGAAGPRWFQLAEGAGA